MDASKTDSIQQLADGAWTRLRNVIGALDRVDRLETASKFAGWLQGLAEDDAALEATIREFLLRGLRLASDPVNARILTTLEHSTSTSLLDLLETTGLRRVELVERLTELARSGLCIQTLEGDRVEATVLTHGFLSLVDELSAQVKARAQNDYMLNPKAPLPNPKIQIPTSKFDLR
jgi:hypothetical protein